MYHFIRIIITQGPRMIITVGCGSVCVRATFTYWIHNNRADSIAIVLNIDPTAIEQIT